MVVVVLHLEFHNADYVELHNISGVDQDITGFKLFYGSVDGNLASTTTNGLKKVK